MNKDGTLLLMMKKDRDGLIQLVLFSILPLTPVMFNLTQEF